VIQREFQERLNRRARRAHLTVSNELASSLFRYFALLAKWNTKMNLTALPLNPPSDETFDRLFVEPLAVAAQVRGGNGRWVDLGSGGGSPAIPLKLSSSEWSLTMVESKARKAAFLREAIRAIPVSNADVENVRFEDLVRLEELTGAIDLVTVRAVRADRALAAAAALLLKPGGRLLMFRPDAATETLRGFKVSDTMALGTEKPAFVTIYVRTGVFHVEQSR
jgi:16S rRNA (guanine527-N7)-methyltransferase